MKEQDTYRTTKFTISKQTLHGMTITTESIFLTWFHTHLIKITTQTVILTITSQTLRILCKQTANHTTYTYTWD